MKEKGNERAQAGGAVGAGLAAAGSLAAWQPAQAQAQTVVRYYHTDALGSVVAVTDASGNVVERREYEPYGAQLTPAVQDGPGYTGHVQDAATGLVYMQQRYYDPGIGMFLSVDPVAALSSPVAQFHRYRYANNNPYKFTDPDGRAVTCDENRCTGTSNSILEMAVDYGTVSVIYARRLLENAVVSIQNNEATDRPLDSSSSAGEKIKDGTSPAAGVSGVKGEREGSGGQVGADGAFDSVSGTNERSPKEGVRIKDLEGGGTIETHPSTKSANYPQGTPTVKVQDADGRVETTVRYPKEEIK